ncbi:MAG: hypothetical protein JWR80_7327 [Bradyrhizobium sp.]|nr:hypothetical protein [Bradyrhizobium sp.]
MTEDEELPPAPSIIDVGDVIGVIGAGVAGYGVWLIYQPAAFIFGGVALIGVAFVTAIKKARR